MRQARLLPLRRINLLEDFCEKTWKSRKSLTSAKIRDRVPNAHVSRAGRLKIKGKVARSA
jgi:hypothetical protein